MYGGYVDVSKVVNAVIRSKTTNTTAVASLPYTIKDGPSGAKVSKSEIALKFRNKIFIKTLVGL